THSQVLEDALVLLDRTLRFVQGGPAYEHPRLLAARLLDEVLQDAVITVASLASPDEQQPARLAPRHVRYLRSNHGAPGPCELDQMATNAWRGRPTPCHPLGYGLDPSRHPRSRDRPAHAAGGGF